MDVAVRPNTAYSLSGWFRTDRLQPSGPRTTTDQYPVPARVAVSEVTGTTTRFLTALSSYTDTTAWHRRTLAVRTVPGARALQLTLKIVDGSGTVWFDDLALREVLQPTSQRFGGTVTTAGPGALRQVASISGGLTLNATYTASADRITVDGRVSSTSNADVPLELSYTLPVNATGWSWHDDGRRQRTMASSGTYANETRLQPQRTSRYPWGTISDEQSSLSMGIPLDMPRIQRLRYSPSGLTISFDLGISPRATGLGPVATFRFVIFTSAPAWGFRAATEHYYRMYPDFFTRRTDPAREGGWGARAAYGAWSDRTKDFGIGLDMVPLASGQIGQANAALVAKDDEEGLYSVLYNHHWGYKQEQGTFGVFPTYAAAVQSLRDEADGPRATLRERARADRAAAALRSTPLDLNGQRIYEGYPWRDSFYLNWYQDLDPLPGATDWTRVSRTYQLDPGVEGAAAAGVQLDGLHMDSTSGMRRWAATDDYSPAHWASAELPLTFSYDSAEVSKRIVFTDYRELVRTSDYAHSLGMIFSANFNASDAGALNWFGADVIDYFGIERGLPEKAVVEPYSTVDSLALLKRSLAHQRPVSTLDPLVSDGSLTTAQVEDRLQLNLFYGIFAGIGGGTNLTEAVRGLYLRYTPLFREINTAGWEPVTGAWTGDADAWLERFGGIEDGVQYLTIRNPSSAAKRVIVSFGMRGSAVDPSSLTGRELVTGSPVSVTAASPGTGRFELDVPAGDTRVVRLRAP
ncbi:MAG: hypothetical protein H0W07_05910 [Chloroflexi bacterium]|nr:hypothetical protein [Chloroflexota bacterium]